MGVPRIGPDDDLLKDVPMVEAAPTAPDSPTAEQNGAEPPESRLTGHSSTRPAATPQHPLVQAIGPLLDRIGAIFVDPLDLRTDDVPLEWDDEIVGGIRLPTTVPAESSAIARSDEEGSGETGGGLEGIIVDIERFFGTPLADLPRARKQQAVRMFEESGAFSYRKSVEAVAAALGISRFTVYNYLNRDRA